MLCATAASASSEYLPPETAFALHASMTAPRTLTFQFRIAPGYHLYRERLHATLIDPQGQKNQVVIAQSNAAGASAPALLLPGARRVLDPALGLEMDLYEGELQALLLLPAASGGGPITALLEYQGCAAAGVCYPPQQARVRLTPNSQGGYTTNDATTPEPVSPAPGPGQGEGAAASLDFQRIASLEGLRESMRSSQTAAVLVFGADWCAACRRQEELLADPRVQARLAWLRRLRVDLTQTTEANRELLAHFGLVGVPALVFLDRSGAIITSARLVGPNGPEDILRALDLVLPG